MSDQLYIGIDPGKSGAVAFLSPRGDPWFVKAKETPADIAQAIREACREYETSQIFCLIERVWSSPGAGVKSMFSFGESYGMLTGFIVALNVPYETVLPNTWQGAMSCKTKGDKNVTKAKAQSLYPNLKITHANADALIIATYAKRSRFTL